MWKNKKKYRKRWFDVTESVLKMTEDLERT